MRKIESAMVAAVKAGRDWRSGNTSVDVTDQGIIIRLHGNKIAEVIPEDHIMWITDAGWQTTTTKSRLNALLSGVTNRGSIYQKSYVWYLDRDLDTVEMERDMAYAVSL